MLDELFKFILLIYLRVHRFIRLITVIVVVMNMDEGGLVQL